MDVYYTASLNYNTTQENISAEVEQPIKFSQFWISNNQSEQVMLIIWADEKPIPELVITADTIYRVVNAHGLLYFISGANVIPSDPVMDSITIEKTLHISYIGTGAGVLAVLMKGVWLTTKRLWLLEEIAQIKQVSRDNVYPTPGSEFYTVKRSGAFRQPGID